MSCSINPNRRKVKRNDPPGNIFLVGFMGSGKSTVGPIIASISSRGFIDTDALIERAEGVSIGQIIKAHGEPRFRALELKAIERACAMQNVVVSTGGGSVLDGENVFNMRNSGTVVWLNCPPEVIYERVKNDNSRPLLQVNDKLSTIREILSCRELIYRRAAHVIVNCESKKPFRIAREACNLVRQRRATQL
ncbi:MAG: shikimate kinase [Clostridiales bacterium]|jgi:shikimate kinase|nr:shikimate kinase [Clostridiales bacterium]